MARQPNPVMASSDWCSSLFVSSVTTAFTFPHDTLAISGGQITYGSDYPYIGLGQFAQLQKLGLSTDDLDAIGHRNATRLVPRLQG